MHIVILCKVISVVLVEELSGCVFGIIKGILLSKGLPMTPVQVVMSGRRQEAEELMKLCEPGVIDKIRYLVKSGEHIFEVDEFYGENEGLTVAEVELNSEDELFKKPHFIEKEVTGDIRYYNSFLMKNPYTRW